MSTDVNEIEAPDAPGREARQGRPGRLSRPARLRRAALALALALALLALARPAAAQTPPGGSFVAHQVGILFAAMVVELISFVVVGVLDQQIDRRT